MKYDFESFLAVARRIDGELLAKCPFHNDSRPSFSANVHTGLWICHAGCGQGNFDHFLKQIASARYAKPRGKRSGQNGFGDLSGFAAVAKYEYMDETGAYHLRVTRFENSAGEKRFCQEHVDASGRWVNGGAIKDVLPYLIHEWIDCDGETIFLVEGEKCAEFLRACGAKATTVPGGANKWKPHYAKQFQGKRVVILPDNDEAGLKFAHAAHISLYLSKIPVSIFHLPGLGPSEDVVDWFHQGNDLVNLTKLMGHL